MEYNWFEIGKRIRKLRASKGWSQDEYVEQLRAQGVNTTRNRISAIENGRKDKISFPVLLASCKLFDCDIGYMLGEYAYKTRKICDINEVLGLSEAAIRQLAYLKAASPKVIEALNRLIEFNDSDVIRLVEGFLKYDCTDQIETERGLFTGHAVEQMFVLEIASELVAIKQKGK